MPLHFFTFIRLLKFEYVCHDEVMIWKCFPHYYFSVSKSLSHWWIPSQKPSNAYIWDTLMFIWRHCYAVIYRLFSKWPTRSSETPQHFVTIHHNPSFIIPWPFLLFSGLPIFRVHSVASGGLYLTGYGWCWESVTLWVGRYSILHWNMDIDKVYFGHINWFYYILFF